MGMPAEELEHRFEDDEIDYLTDVSAIRALVRHDDSWISMRIALDARILLLEEEAHDASCPHRDRALRRIASGLSEVRAALDALLDAASPQAPYAGPLAKYVGGVYLWSSEVAAAATDIAHSIGWQRKRDEAAAASRSWLLGQLGEDVGELRFACAGRIAERVERLHAEVAAVNCDLGGAC